VATTLRRVNDNDDVHDPPADAITPRASSEIEAFDASNLPAASLPSAAPTRTARWLAFASIAVAGLCGALIGYAFTDLQCTSGCSTLAGFGALIGALVGAIGVAVVAVLVLRAMDEWESVKGGGSPGRREPS